MTLSRSRWVLLPAGRRAAIVAVAMAPALAACNGTSTSVSLPARSPATVPATSSPPAALSPRQQVVAAFTGYNDALIAAEKSGNAAEARDLLRPYLTASQIDGTVQTMSSIWASGEVFYGQDVVHILSVTVDGTTAFVHDCEDTSGAGLKNVKTGQIVPGSGGVPHLNLVTRLGLASGHWLVESQVIEDVPCAA